MPKEKEKGTKTPPIVAQPRKKMVNTTDAEILKIIEHTKVLSIV